MKNIQTSVEIVAVLLFILGPLTRTCDYGTDQLTWVEILSRWKIFGPLLKLWLVYSNWGLWQVLVKPTWCSTSPPPARKSFKNQHRSNQTYPHSCILIISPFTIHCIEEQQNHQGIEKNSKEAHWLSENPKETNWSPLNPIKPQIIPLKTMNPKSKGVLKKFNQGLVSVKICLQN